MNEASDGARALRYLEARKNADGKVTLVGKGWNPNAKRWHLEEVAIPRKDIEKGDKDDFSALKSVSIGKPGGSRQGVIILKSPIWLKLGTNVRHHELTIV